MQDFLTLAKNRYSVRSFQNKPVEKSALNAVLEAGNLAPTGCNKQPQRVWVIQSEEGLAKIFIQAGCIISTPTCGPCLGGYMGILAHGERAISTNNSNFVGRMGHITSEIYLASPAVAAASAIAGYICSPEDIQ